MKKILFILLFIISMGNVCAYTEYKISDEVTYNNVNYYVIADSSASESSVTLLKAEPLTVEEVNQYGTGHVNRYTFDSVGTAYDSNGYGGMAYYTSETCGYSTSKGCITDYAESEIKYVVDAWKSAKAPNASEARLITIDDLMINLGYEEHQYCSAGECSILKSKTENVPTWVYNSNYYYWTMVSSDNFVLFINYSGDTGGISVFGRYYFGGSSLMVVRPVVVLKKIALGDEEEIVVGENEQTDNQSSIDDKKTNTRYSVGDKVRYNKVNYYVIKGNDSTVTLLKAEPLTVSEVNTYGGVGTANNHVNMYVTSNTNSEYYQTASNQNGYGGMAYYSGVTCGGAAGTYAGCTTNYLQSEIKYVVDAWKEDQAPLATEARLITIDEVSSLGYDNSVACTGFCYYYGSVTNVLTWVYNSNYWYWTMSQNGDSLFDVWNVYTNGGIYYHRVDGDGSFGAVRPVITLSRSILDEENNLNNENKISNGGKTEIVNTPNTMEKISVLFILIGVILVSISIVIVIRNRK